MVHGESYFAAAMSFAECTNDEAVVKKLFLKYNIDI